MPFPNQLAAINRARAWGRAEFGVTCGVIIDIPRHIAPEDGLTVTEWAISGYGNGVVALGLAGLEAGYLAEKFAASFERASAVGIPSVPHAGEHAGPESVWSAIRVCNPVRIGHGVRSIEDPELVAYLRDQRIPLEVCPTSNVALKGYPTLADHPIQRLMDAGVIVTVNSDDPPMFNTTLTREFQVCAETFGWDANTIETLTCNAVRATLLSAEERVALLERVEKEFHRLRAEYGV
jgi:adenosine deaminase